jgi:hypothetical protein
LTTIKNKVKHPKACFTIEYHLCHIDDQSILAAIVLNSYLCNQLGNALFCVTSGIFAGRAQRDPAKSHELHKIAFPNVLHTRFFLILTKKMFLQTLNEVMNFINNKLLLC